MLIPVDFGKLVDICNLKTTNLNGITKVSGHQLDCIRDARPVICEKTEVKDSLALSDWGHALSLSGDGTYLQSDDMSEKRGHGTCLLCLALGPFRGF